MHLSWHYTDRFGTPVGECPIRCARPWRLAVYYRMLPSQRAYQAGTVGQEPTFRSRCEPGGFRPQVGRSSPLPRTGRGSLPGAIGALRSELLLEEVAHRSPRALVGLLVIEDRRVERAVGLGVGEAVQGVAI